MAHVESTSRTGPSKATWSTRATECGRSPGRIPDLSGTACRPLATDAASGAVSLKRWIHRSPRNRWSRLSSAADKTFTATPRTLAATATGTWSVVSISATLIRPFCRGELPPPPSVSSATATPSAVQRDGDADGDGAHRGTPTNACASIASAARRYSSASQSAPRCRYNCVEAIERCPAWAGNASIDMPCLRSRVRHV